MADYNYDQSGAPLSSTFIAGGDAAAASSTFVAGGAESVAMSGAPGSSTFLPSGQIESMQLQSTFIQGQGGGGGVTVMTLPGGHDPDDDDDGTILSVPGWLFWSVLGLMSLAIIVVITMLSIECCGSNLPGKTVRLAGEREGITDDGSGRVRKAAEAAEGPGGGGAGAPLGPGGGGAIPPPPQLDEKVKEEISQKCGAEGVSKWGVVKDNMKPLLKDEMTLIEKYAMAFVVAEACFGQNALGAAKGTKDDLVELLRNVPEGVEDDAFIESLFPPVTGAVNFGAELVNQAWEVVESLRKVEGEGNKLADDPGVKKAIKDLADALESTPAPP
ncbi:unnamed protein product, partial [Amoebophrya sp. A25]|eukprot:GSA25T00022505001.1